MRRLPEPWVYALSLAGMLALWWICALVKADAQVLPTPAEVARVMWVEAASGRLGHHMAATLGRVALAFVLAMGVGGVLGLAMGRLREFDRWADPWLVVLLNLPALVVVVLCYLWIGLTEAAAVTAVTLNKLAMVAVTLREGTRAMDRDLDEMATVYRLSWWERLRQVWLPQLVPYIASSARNGLAMIWKIVLVAEFLGRSSGIGFRIHLHFQMFETGAVLAYALSFIVVVLVLDRVVLQGWEARATRWRRVAA